MYQVGTFVNQKDLLGQCSAFLKIRGQRSRSPHDQMWTKIQFWNHSSIQMYQAGTFVNQTDSLRAVFSISENLRSKSQGHHIWVKMQFWNYMYNYLNIPGSNFCQMKTLSGAVLSISENLRCKGQVHHMTTYGQNYSFGINSIQMY